MTKQERLLEIRQSSYSESKKQAKRKKIHSGIRIGFIIGIAASLLIGIIATPIDDKNAFEDYKDNPGTEVTDETFRSEETYTLWSEIALHNNINCLMHGGKEYYSENLQIFPSADFAVTELTINGNTLPLTDDTCSYINVVDESVIYYRKDSDFGIYSYSISDNKEIKLCDGQAGEVIVYGDAVYFVDLDDGCKLKYFKFDNKNEICLVDESIEQFMIYGDQCLYLTSDNKLKKKNITSDTGSTTILGAYNGFCFNGEVVAQSGDRLLTFDLDGGSAKKIYESPDNSFLLIGCGSDCAYLFQDGSIKVVLLTNSDGVASVVAGSCGDYVDSLLEDKSKIWAVSYSMGRDGSVKKDLICHSVNNGIEVTENGDQ